MEKASSGSTPPSMAAREASVTTQIAIFFACRSASLESCPTFQNLHSEIVIGEIGHQIGVSAAWLSALFHRVEGVTIQQYIRREKIRLAQNLLRYSDYDVKSIANYLAFCSQSHFSFLLSFLFQIPLYCCMVKTE